MDQKLAEEKGTDRHESPRLALPVPKSDHGLRKTHREPYGRTFVKDEWATRQVKPMTEGLQNFKYYVMRTSYAGRMMERQARAEGSGRSKEAEQRQKLERSERCVEMVHNEEDKVIEDISGEQIEETRKMKWADMCNEAQQAEVARPAAGGKKGRRKGERCQQEERERKQTHGEKNGGCKKTRNEKQQDEEGRRQQQQEEQQGLERQRQEERTKEGEQGTDTGRCKRLRRAKGAQGEEEAGQEMSRGPDREMINRRDEACPGDGDVPGRGKLENRPIELWGLWRKRTVGTGELRHADRRCQKWRANPGTGNGTMGHGGSSRDCE